MLETADNTEIPKHWLSLAKSVSQNPTEFPLWQKLIKLTETLPTTNPKRPLELTKSSNKSWIKLLYITYENILIQFPYLEQYWINFANWRYKLDNDLSTVDTVYEKALNIIPCSTLIWESYLKYTLHVKNNYDDIYDIFEKAVDRVGYHFYSHSIYDLFLEFLKNQEMDRLYHYLVRRIIEIPLFHYSKYFKLWLHLIETSDLTTIKFMIPEADLTKHFKLQYKDLIDEETFKTFKQSFRKTFLDVFITTQFNVYQLFNFEKKINVPYYEPNRELTRDELNNWNLFLQYVETLNLKKSKDDAVNNNNMKLIDTAYERCYIRTNQYPNFWIKYANFKMNLGFLNDAKELLIKGSYFNHVGNTKLKMRLIDLELLEGGTQIAKDLILEMSEVLPNNLEVFLKLLQVEKITGSIASGANFLKLINWKLGEVQATKFESQFDYLFVEVLSHTNLNLDQIEKFLISNKKTKINSFYYNKAVIQFYTFYKQDNEKLETAKKSITDNSIRQRLNIKDPENDDFFPL